MGLRDNAAALVRRFADAIGRPAFADTPFPSGQAETSQQQSVELGAAGTFLFGGFLRGEDFNAQMDGLTGIRNLDEMRKSDAQCHAALEVVKMPIRTAKFSVEPSDADDPTAVHIAKFVEWNLFEGMSTSWDDVIRQALLMLDFGHSVFEKVWSVQDDGEWANHIIVRKLAPRLQRTIWQWFTDTDGQLLSIKQLAVKAGNYQFLDIPAEKVVLFTFQREGDNFAGQSLLRTAYAHWLMKKNFYVIDAIRASRFGVGIPRAKIQPGYKPTIEDRQAIAQMLQGMSAHQHAYLIEPPQMTVDILMPQGVRGGVSLMDSIEHQNEQITRNILAQFLDMGGRSQGGSRALGASAMGFFLNAINSIADQICEGLNKQLIRQLVDYNFPGTAQYPELKPTGIQETDVQSLAAAAAALAAAGLLTAGDKPTENTFRRLMNLPEVPEVDPVTGQQLDPSTGAPAPGAPAGAPPDAAGGGVPAVASITAPAAASATSASSTAATSAVGPAAARYPHEVQAEQQAIFDANSTPANLAPQPTATPAHTTTTEYLPAEYQYVPPYVPQPAPQMTIPSPGDTGEEDHSRAMTSTSHDPSTRALASSSRSRRSAPPWTTGDGQSFWRPPTTTEAKILDLRELPSRLARYQTALKGTLLSVKEEQILRIARGVAHAADPLTVKAPLVGKMASDIRAAMEDAHTYGKTAVRDELNRQRRAMRFAEWDESQHPRDDNGRFAGGSGEFASKLLARARGERQGHEDGKPVWVTDKPQETHFLTSDGTRIGGRGEHNDLSWEAVGKGLDSLLMDGVVRYSAGYGGVQFVGKLTEKQAQTIADDWNYIYKQTLTVDSVQIKNGKPDYEGSRYAHLEPPFTADALRNWANNPSANWKESGLNISRAFAEWDESQHPRDDHGRFAISDDPAVQEFVTKYPYTRDTLAAYQAKHGEKKLIQEVTDHWHNVRGTSNVVPSMEFQQAIYQAGKDRNKARAVERNAKAKERKALVIAELKKRGYAVGDRVIHTDFGEKGTLKIDRKGEPYIESDKGNKHNFGSAWKVLGKAMAEVALWDESQHPRANDGTFTDSGGGDGPKLVHDAGAEHQWTMDADDAVFQLAAGRHVDVTPDAVMGILKKSAGRTDDPNLTQIHVEGGFPFGGRGLDIAREDMPQIPKDQREQFLESIEAKGVRVRTELVKPIALKPSQKEISTRRVGIMLKKYRDDPDRPFPPVLVSKDGYILDGHHHWGLMAALSMEVPNIKIPVFRLMVNHEHALRLMHQYDKRHGIEHESIAAAEWDESQHPRAGDGKFTSGSGDTHDRVERAKKTYVPSTREKQLIADASEKEFRDMVGGERTGDNEAFDVVLKIGGKLHAVEIKTFVENSNDKITVHPESHARKERWARGHHAEMHTVVFDKRQDKVQIYYRRGVGAFRLSTLTPVRDRKQLRELMTE